MTRYLLVIGAQRCGTTYLYQLLDEHPEVAMAKPARPEPKVFLDEAKAEKGLDWYESTYFEGAGAAPVHGEKSTSYLESSEAATRAAKVIPTANTLVILRDPIERAVSNWRFSTASGFEERPLEQALRESLEGPRDWDPAVTSVSPFAYLERGRYSDYLAPWKSSFPRLHVLFLEELAGNAEAVADMYGRIEVDSDFRPPSLTSRINASNGAASALEPGLVKSLRDYFAASDERLRNHLGRRLPWTTR